MRIPQSPFPNWEPAQRVGVRRTNPQSSCSSTPIPLGRPGSLIGKNSKGIYCFVAAKLDEFQFKTLVPVSYKGVCEAGYSH